jgi:hypothetical protein
MKSRDLPLRVQLGRKLFSNAGIDPARPEKGVADQLAVHLTDLEMRIQRDC